MNFRKTKILINDLLKVKSRPKFKTKYILNAIYDELKEIHSLLENKESDRKTLNWLLLEKDDTIRKLKKDWLLKKGKINTNDI